eukprot:1100089_1
MCDSIVAVANHAPLSSPSTQGNSLSLFLAISLLLEVIKKDSQSPGLLAEVGDDSTAGPDGLLDLAIGIQLGQSAPSSQILSAVDHDHGDLALSAQGRMSFLYSSFSQSLARQQRRAERRSRALAHS